LTSPNDSSTTRGSGDQFERLLSLDDAGVWKPAPGACVYAAEACGVEPRDMVLVAVHPGDIDGAGRAGLGTAWIKRGHQPYPAYFTPPAHTVTARSWPTSCGDRDLNPARQTQLDAGVARSQLEQGLLHDLSEGWVDVQNVPRPPGRLC
jgi:beta-phosphoglucomutase-like phosphatase (HAD superfamily)